MNSLFLVCVCYASDRGFRGFTQCPWLMQGSSTSPVSACSQTRDPPGSSDKAPIQREPAWGGNRCCCCCSLQKANRRVWGASGGQLNVVSWSGAWSEPGEGVLICWIQQRQKLETNKSPGGEPCCVQGLPKKIGVLHVTDPDTVNPHMWHYFTAQRPKWAPKTNVGSWWLLTLILAICWGIHSDKCPMFDKVYLYRVHTSIIK